MKSPEAPQPPLKSVSSEFRPYLTSTGLAGIAIAMQQLLLAWILIGILELPASEVGLVQAVVGIPGIVLILLGEQSGWYGPPRSVDQGLCLRAGSAAVSGGHAEFFSDRALEHSALGSGHEFCHFLHQPGTAGSAESGRAGEVQSPFQPPLRSDSLCRSWGWQWPARWKCSG